MLVEEAVEEGRAALVGCGRRQEAVEEGRRMRERSRDAVREGLRERCQEAVEEGRAALVGCGGRGILTGGAVEEGYQNTLVHPPLTAAAVELDRLRALVLTPKWLFGGLSRRVISTDCPEMQYTLWSCFGREIGRVDKAYREGMGDLEAVWEEVASAAASASVAMHA